MRDVLNVGDILLEKNKNKYELTQVPLINGAMVVMDPHGKSFSYVWWLGF